MSRIVDHSSYAVGRGRALGHVAMIGFAVMVAGSFTVGALIVPHVDPAPLNAVRFVLAAAMMGGVAFLVRGHRFAVPVAAWRFVLLGALNGAYFVTMFIALTMTEPVATSAVFTLSPLLTAISAFLILGQRTRPLVLFSIALAASGALWVIFRADIDALLSFAIGPGETVFLFGCVAYALVSPLMRKLDRGEPGVVFTFWLLVGTAMCIGAYGAMGIARTQWFDLPADVWWGILYLAVFPTALSFFLLQFASLRLPSSKVMAYVYLLPGLVIVIEGVIGHGWASPAIIMGAGVTVAALVVLAVAAD